MFKTDSLRMKTIYRRIEILIDNRFNKTTTTIGRILSQELIVQLICSLTATTILYLLNNIKSRTQPYPLSHSTSLDHNLLSCPARCPTKCSPISDNKVKHGLFTSNKKNKDVNKINNSHSLNDTNYRFLDKIWFIHFGKKLKS